MKITINGDATITEAFSGVGIETDRGTYGIAQRDGSIEVLLDGEVIFDGAADHARRNHPKDPAEECRAAVLRAVERFDMNAHAIHAPPGTEALEGELQRLLALVRTKLDEADLWWGRAEQLLHILSRSVESADCAPPPQLGQTRNQSAPATAAGLVDLAMQAIREERARENGAVEPEDTRSCAELASAGLCLWGMHGMHGQPLPKATHSVQLAEHTIRCCADCASHYVRQGGRLVSEPEAALAHDPDDPSGCEMCPMFDGSPRDGVCAAQNGRTLDLYRSGEPNGRLRFLAPAECPLRTGNVVVRGRS